jgi:hypothetical protein
MEIIKDFMLILERNGLVEKTTRRTVMIWGLGEYEKERIREKSYLRL